MRLPDTARLVAARLVKDPVAPVIPALQYTGPWKVERQVGMVTSSFSASTILPLTMVLTVVAAVSVPETVKSPVSTVAVLPR